MWSYVSKILMGRNIYHCYAEKQIIWFQCMVCQNQVCKPFLMSLEGRSLSISLAEGRVVSMCRSNIRFIILSDHFYPLYRNMHSQHVRDVCKNLSWEGGFISFSHHEERGGWIPINSLETINYTDPTPNFLI